MSRPPSDHSAALEASSAASLMANGPSAPDELQAMARDLYKRRDSSHDFHHAAAVARVTCALCATWEPRVAPSDIRVACAAAYLHDVFDSKYARADTEAVRARLEQEVGFTTADARRAIHLAQSISFSARVLRQGRAPDSCVGVDKTLYYLISDADMLEALGCIGLVRTCVYQSTVSARCPCDLGGVDVALQYVTQVLPLCAEFMTHPLARREAERRRRLMASLVATMRAERMWRAR